MKLLLLFLLVGICSATQRPNIVLILTDDQDLLMGGVLPIKKVQKQVANEGVTFTNAFVSTPICCPSRSSILTGLYQHNHHTLNNSYSGGCSGQQWQDTHEPFTFGSILHSVGYRTFYAGKYLNAYGYKSAGGVNHVPKGWDWWQGLVGNSRYYNYTLSINGTAQHFTDQYLTNVIKNYSLMFLDNMKESKSEDSFLMVLATPAPHTPYTPEPKYKGKYDGIKVPRTPNFNTPKLKNRHWLLNMAPEPLPNETIALIDEYHARRWESLLSVDDMVAAVVDKLDEIHRLNNTYIIYTSDHGYHLGQFSLPWDKRQPYETDIRVPMFVRGPGIQRKTLSPATVVNIDIAPSIVEMAGLDPSLYHMDGLSFLPSIRDPDQKKMRNHFFIEYVGEGDSRTVSSECPLLNDDNLSECSLASSCKCQDARNNTYNCLRHLDSSKNIIYCEFFEGAGSIKEFYNLNKDPFQIKNIFSDLSESEKHNLEETILQYQTCQGVACQFPAE